MEASAVLLVSVIGAVEAHVAASKGVVAPPVPGNIMSPTCVLSESPFTTCTRAFFSLSNGWVQFAVLSRTIRTSAVAPRRSVGEEDVGVVVHRVERGERDRRDPAAAR